MVGLGVDWGLNTLLSAGAARLHHDGTATTLGSGAQFRAAGVLAKQDRLRRHSERLHAKNGQYARLVDPALEAKVAALVEEIGRVSARRANLSDALAWSAARWAVDQAIAASASVIYLEDLRSMEADGMGRTHNTRLSQTVRSKIAHRMRHLAAEASIAVVTVPPANTSKLCPCCLTPLRHRKSPDQPHRDRVEVGDLPQPAVRLAGRPRPGRVAAHRRTRPHPPGHDRARSRHRHPGDPHPCAGRAHRTSRRRGELSGEVAGDGVTGAGGCDFGCDLRADGAVRVSEGAPSAFIVRRNRCHGPDSVSAAGFGVIAPSGPPGPARCR
jgi:hypothetical protein